MALLGGTGFPKIELGTDGGDGSHTFTANDCRKVKYDFTEIKEGPFELANYDLTQFKEGVRFEAEIFFTALTPHNTVLDTFLKTIESYAGTIYCIPHLDYPSAGSPRKYKVLKDGGWDYGYFKDKWLGFAGSIKLIGIKLLSGTWEAES